MDERLAIRCVGHHCKEVLAARVADQQALVPVLGGIADEGPVDLPLPYPSARLTSPTVSTNAVWYLPVGLRTRAGRVGRTCGVVRSLAELQRLSIATGPSGPDRAMRAPDRPWGRWTDRNSRREEVMGRPCLVSRGAYANRIVGASRIAAMSLAACKRPAGTTAGGPGL